jgi:NAD(P)-dependent dehydrogenase (short-subunit alcohol dehydrogenase family)
VTPGGHGAPRLHQILITRTLTLLTRSLEPNWEPITPGIGLVIPEAQARVSAVTALGRPGQPDDIAAAIAALLGDRTHWISGQRIEVSGGMNL